MAAFDFRLHGFNNEVNEQVKKTYYAATSSYYYEIIRSPLNARPKTQSSIKNVRFVTYAHFRNHIRS